MHFQNNEKEELRYKYYWNCDKDFFLIDYDDFRPIALDMWKISRKSDLDQLIIQQFDGCKELYSLLSEILYEYIKHPLDNELNNRFASDLYDLSKFDGDWYHWDLARRLLVSVNAYFYASMIHGFCEEKVLSSPNNDLLLRRFSILISRGDMKNAITMIDDMKADGMHIIWPERYKYVEDYINTLQKKELLKDKFAGYVKDKRIVIMGVAPHDEVIEPQNNTLYTRINYFGKNSIPLTDQLVPNNIGYYNVEKSTELLLKSNVYCDEMDYIVCKDLADEVTIPDQYKNKVRKAFKSFFGCPFGHPLMIPVIVYDLLHYNTGGIYITHNNFYCSDKSYYSEYKSNFSIENVKTLLIGLSSHDLIGNWKLMKTWYKNGFFLCDSEMAAIMELSDVDFGKLVERSFRYQLS